MALSPEQFRLRSQIGGAAKHGNVEKAAKARQELRASRASRAEDYIRELVDTFPPLTAEQRDKLAVLLRGSAD